MSILTERFYDITPQMRQDIAQAFKGYMDDRGFVLVDEQAATRTLCGEARCYIKNHRDREVTHRESKGLKSSVDADLARLDDALRGLTQTSKNMIERGLSVVASEDFLLDRKDPEIKAKVLQHAGVEDALKYLKRAVAEAARFDSISKADRYNYYFISGLIRFYVTTILQENPKAGFTPTPAADLHTFIETIASVFDMDAFDNGVPNLRNRIKDDYIYIAYKS